MKSYKILFLIIVCGLLYNVGVSATNSLRLSNDSIHSVVDKMPRLKGAKNNLSNFFIEKISYPTEARLQAIEGDVWIRFVVTVEGNIRNVEIQKSVDPLLDEAVKSYVEKSGPWKPGVLNKQVVNTQMSVPVQFRLSENDRTLANQLKEFNMLEERPLFVIDNMIIEDYAVIDDYNVESVRVIKGKKAIDIYGERAQYGVVVIKSKRGTPPIY
ncbi:MAG: TonB family protein [Marinilabiliaceae bacterium]|nr:TonB family protein [Marinilabiliaceae bacterium]